MIVCSTCGHLVEDRQGYAVCDSCSTVETPTGHLFTLARWCVFDSTTGELS